MPMKTGRNGTYGAQGDGLINADQACCLIPDGERPLARLGRFLLPSPQGIFFHPSFQYRSL